MKFLNFFLYSFLFNDNSSHDFTICIPSKTYQIDIKSVILTPDPPVIGKNLDIEIDVIPSIELTSITSVLQISMSGIKILQTNIDLCSYVSCPLEPNVLNNIKISEQIPYLLPTGTKLDVNIDGGDILCIDLSFTTK